MPKTHNPRPVSIPKIKVRLSTNPDAIGIMKSNFIDNAVYKLLKNCKKLYLKL